ncbi:hypothetical protein D3C71_77970 [compost metagenome]
MGRLFNDAFLSTLRVALEEDTSGKANNEIEHTYYAQLKDLSQLQKAAELEKQEQWELRIPQTAGFNALGGQIRIRKTEVAKREGDTPLGPESQTSPAEYVLTVKVQGGADGGRREASLPASEDIFTMFKFLSGKGMVKHRYIFPVEGSDRIWEVDTFLKEDGTYSDWVKIDFEVEDLNATVPPLPVSVDMETIVTNAKNHMTEAEQKLVTDLYDRVFLTLNQYLKGKGETPKGVDKEGKTADQTEANPEP